MYCVLDIYKRNLEVIYKTTLCSKATLFVLVTNIVAICLPFLFAYRSRGFWLKHDTFYEQPNVRFRGEYLFVGLTTNLSNVIICNNINEFAQLRDVDKCSIFKVREIDQNFDGKPDTLEFEVEIVYPPNTNEYSNININMQHVTLFIPLDYRLNTLCPLRMQAAIILQQTIIPNVNDLTIYGNLQLEQKVPLHCYPKMTEKLQDIITLSTNAGKENKDNNQLENFRIENIIQNYLQRNLTTHLTDSYTTFSFKPANFHLKLIVDYPQQAMHYRPGFWQVIKWAWIQYLALYVIFAWFIRKVQNYIFKNDLLLVFKSLPNILHSNKKYH